MRSIIKLNRRQLIVLISAFAAMIMILSTGFVLRAHAMSYEETAEQEVYYKYTAMYRVCAGDTLSSIAEMYMDDVHYSSESEYISELRKMNQIYFGDDLTTGELITVCYYSTEYR
ncbi:MAG: LysM peptidoglycan-binding domain-containing protein [Lachnospiraceae bacterium]|nr:LysM peptidoglycan-binding domain-containing protein [Lachnospiraceae bacterium]